MPPTTRLTRLLPFTLVCASLLSGCEPMALTAVSAGSSTAVSHTLNGITYRTFTQPSSKVRLATLNAMKRMDIKLLSDSKPEKDNVLVLKGQTSERNVEIQLEPISANVTRMRVTAKSHVIIYDSATATEIILQTERSLGRA